MRKGKSEATEMKRWRKWIGVAFIMPSLIGMLVFYIIPFIVSFTYCFTMGIGQRQFVGLANFRELFANNNYRLALKNTLFITGVALPLLCLLAISMALFIEKGLAKRKWLQGSLLIPMAMPAASLMLLWEDIFAQKGILNGLLGTHVDWLHSSLAPWVIIGMIVWKNLGYNILLIISSLLMMPREYEEAALMDGANFMQIATKIKLPYLMPMLFFEVIISLSNCFKIFREVYLLQGSYPEVNLYLLQHFMNNHFAKLNYELLSTAAFTLYSVIFLIILFVVIGQSRTRRTW